MNREVCEHYTPLSLHCDKCQLSPIDRLGIAISNAGITWTDEMRQAWDDAKDEYEARQHMTSNAEVSRGAQATAKTNDA